MDPALMQLFSLEEVLERVGRNGLTGSFHVFTPKDSANIFVRDGVVIAAFHGLFEGEEVLRKVLDWKGAQFMWQPNAVMMGLAQKPMKINIIDFLTKQRPAPAAGNLLADVTRPTKAAVTSTLTLKPSDSTPVDMSATKNMTTETDRQARDEALLNKYKMALVPVDGPKQRLRITRVSSLVGRNPACDITIVHPSISRQHCMLQMTERGLHVKDLDTTNGTQVNSILMKEGYINVGDKLTVGHLVFELQKD